jgi:hypothetical protein
MKQWYDKDAMIREFKLGEKVFALSFIRQSFKKKKQFGRSMSYLPSWSKAAPTPTSLTSNVNLYSLEKTCVVT